MKVRLYKTGLLLLALTLSNILSAAQTINPNIANDTPDSRYSIHADATVTDALTGLIWAQCSEGLSGSDCSTGTAATFTWQAALTTAQASTLAGFSDWRLPNVEELRSLVAYDRYSPAINSSVFPNTLSTGYWSSSPVAFNSGYAWGVTFVSGLGYGGNRSYGNRVRLVRGGQ